MILVIEDAHDIAQVVSRELVAAGYHVVTVGDGVSGLAAHTREQPALVILDWMLPEMDGLEVLRRLRQSASTPVLMLTARSEEVDRVIGLEVGARLGRRVERYAEEVGGAVLALVGVLILTRVMG